MPADVRSSSLPASSSSRSVPRPVLACGGLIGPNGAVNLLRTTTFAGYHDGVEHYVTSFEFAGGGGAFGSLTPLPGVPTSVEKGGDWTLQRLIRETEPDRRLRRSSSRGRRAARRRRRGPACEVTIDALDITVLRGGADEVGQWATDHGFRLPPDAPEVLEFYAAAQPDLPGRRVRRRRGRRARPERRRRHPRPHHHPDRQPVGPAADPRPRQDRQRDDPGRCLPPDRRRPGPAAGTRRLQRPEASITASAATPGSARRPAVRPRHGVGPGRRLADEGRASMPMRTQLGFDLAIDASGAGTPSRVDAGLDLPGAVDPTDRRPRCAGSPRCRVLGGRASDRSSSSSLAARPTAACDPA